MSKYRSKIIALFLILMTGGCATLPTKEELRAQKPIYLKDVCAQNNVHWQWDNVAQVATLVYQDKKAEVLVGSDLVLVDKGRVTLSAPVRMVRSTVIVPPDFQSKVISRLHWQAAGTYPDEAWKVREIMIDAGHGGKDPGAIGRMGIQEKGIVLDISKRLVHILREGGLKVAMTRDDDEFISLQRRTEITSLSNADVFVSIHANASPVRSVHGIEIFTAKNLAINDKDEKQRTTNENLMFRNLSMDTSDPDVKRIVSDMLYTHKQAESKVLASQVAKKTARHVHAKNRGDKLSRFYVLRNTLIPAILVEVGFLTNPKEARLLETSAYRQKVARGIAESIFDYANGQQ